MGESHQIRCYDYVNRGYDEVRQALSANVQELFRAATKSAASRAELVASELRVDVGGIQVSASVEIQVSELEDHASRGRTPTSSSLDLSWAATRSRRLFPAMHATLWIYPITARETQLDFRGEYEPPLGILGDALNAMVGHRIAEACVHRFVSDIAEHLRSLLPHDASDPTRKA